MSGEERWAGEYEVGVGGCGEGERGEVNVSKYDGGSGVSWWVIEGGVDEDGIEGGVCGHERGGVKLSGYDHGGGDSWWAIEGGG